MNKLAKTILYGIGIGLSLVLTIAIYLSRHNDQKSLVSAGLVMMYALLVIAIIAAFFMAIKSIRNTATKGKWTLLSVGVLVVLIFLGYLLDNHQIKEGYLQYGISTEVKSGIIGGSLIATWIVLGIAVLFSIYTAFTDFKNRL
jgi:phosphatidylglycerophosphate synthase